MADLHAPPDTVVNASIVPTRAAIADFASERESLLYNAGRDEASVLNGTATEIWRLCDGVQSVDGIAQVLAQRYGVDRDLLLDDVVQTLLVLRRRGLVDWPGQVRSDVT